MGTTEQKVKELEEALAESDKEHQLFIVDPSTNSSIHVGEMLDRLADQIAEDNLKNGFGEDEDLVEDCIHESGELSKDTDPVISIVRKAFLAQKIALIHSELSEALEALRKDLMDDHITDMDGFTVEIADALIRILDLAGREQLSLGEAFERKSAYNRTRPFKHGKTF